MRFKIFIKSMHGPRRYAIGSLVLLVSEDSALSRDVLGNVARITVTVVTQYLCKVESIALPPATLSRLQLLLRCSSFCIPNIADVSFSRL
jgi:hypothetical protein